MTAGEMLEARGRAKMLLEQLTVKFGRVSPIVEQTVLSAGLDKLDMWAERVLTVSTIDEVLA